MTYNLKPGTYSVTISGVNMTETREQRIQRLMLQNGRYGAKGTLPATMLFNPEMVDKLTECARRIADQMTAKPLRYLQRLEPAVLWLKSKGKQPRRVRVKIGASYLAIDMEVCNSNSFPQPDWSKK